MRDLTRWLSRRAARGARPAKIAPLGPVDPTQHPVSVTFVPSNATVAIHGETPTNANTTTAGAYSYELEAGHYGVSISRAGYFTHHTVFTYASGNYAAVDTTLEAEPDFASWEQRYLDPVSGSDSNNGLTSGAAWKTMYYAMRQAALVSSSLNVCVNILDGTIVEDAVSHGNHSASRKIAFKAVNAGSVVWSGCDTETSWTLSDSGDTSGLYYCPWTNDWGVPADPYTGMSELGRRREVVIVNDERMVQKYVMTDGVYDEAATITAVLAQAGSFYVDEVGDRIYLNAPSGVDPRVTATHTVELGQRSFSVYMQGYANAIFSGIKWRGWASPISGSAAIRTADTSGLWFLDCKFHLNNGVGFSFGGGSVKNSLRIVRCDFRENGIAGWAGGRCTNLLIDDITDSGTGWRCASGGVYGWWVGNKILESHDVLVRNYVSTGAYGVRTLWPDTDLKNMLVVNYNASGHASGRPPVFIENLQGPVVWDGGTVENNGSGGILFSKAQKVVMRNATVRNNGTQYGNFTASGDNSAAFTSKVDGLTYTVFHEDWDIRDMVIETSGTVPLWRAGPNTTRWNNLMASSVIDRNAYKAVSADSTVFRQVNGTLLTFAQWKTHIGGGKEANSTMSAY